VGAAGGRAADRLPPPAPVAGGRADAGAEGGGAVRVLRRADLGILHSPG
jgi:hypothetical protein